MGAHHEVNVKSHRAPPNVRTDYSSGVHHCPPPLQLRVLSEVSEHSLPIQIPIPFLIPFSAEAVGNTVVPLFCLLRRLSSSFAAQ